MATKLNSMNSKEREEPRKLMDKVVGVYTLDRGIHTGHNTITN